MPDGVWEACLPAAHRRFTELDRRLFHPRVDFGVSMRGFETDVPSQPAANHIDVNACFQEMNGRGITKSRADSLDGSPSHRSAGRPRSSDGERSCRSRSV